MKYNIIKGECFALIPARSGSKGVPQKNVRLLKGFPLIAYTIAACNLSKQIDRVIVTTDSEEIAGIAKQYGSEAPFLRPAEISGDNSGDYGFVKHALDWFQDNEGRVPEYIVHMRPTTPLRNFTIIDDAISIMKNSREFTSLRSAHLAPESPFKWFIKKDDNCFTSILKGVSNEEANNSRQTFEDVYIPDGYVDIVRTEYVLDKGVLHGEKMYAFVSPFCTEVDTIAEFRLLDYEISTQKYELFEYMKGRYTSE